MFGDVMTEEHLNDGCWGVVGERKLDWERLELNHSILCVHVTILRL